MSDAIWLKLIEQLPQIIGSIFSGAAAILAGWSLIQSKRNQTKITEVHDSVNGKMEQLLDVTKTSAHAEGVKDELERVK